MSKSGCTVIALAALGLLLLMAGVAFGGPGDLDRGFGADGRRIITGVSAAEALAIQPDGRIVVVGWNGNVAVARLKPDGSNDPAFGGTRFVDFGSFDLGQAVALQPDGKIVVVGRTSDNVTIARLNANGSLDMGFGSGGKRTIDYGGRDGAEGVAVQPDGKILVAGFGGADRNLLVTRLHGDGTNDTDFGSGGTARIDFGLGPEEGRALALQADGKIVVAGFTIGSTGNFDDVAIARLNPGGAPDMGFGVQGRRRISPRPRRQGRGVGPPAGRQDRHGRHRLRPVLGDAAQPQRLRRQQLRRRRSPPRPVRHLLRGWRGRGVAAGRQSRRRWMGGQRPRDRPPAARRPARHDLRRLRPRRQPNRQADDQPGAGNAVALQADGRIVVAGYAA